YALHRRFRAFEPGRAVLTVAEIAMLAVIVATLVWVPVSRVSVLAVDVVFFPAVLIFARDGGLVSRVLQARPLEVLGRLSFAIYMTHLFLVIGFNRALPFVLRAMDRPDLVVTQGRTTFGLSSVELGQPAETALTVVILVLVLGLGWLGWRYVEEPARQRSRALIGPVSPLPQN
ncbi:MAG: hypothetical protein WA842_02615, partial [Croceibacterium sp.]